MVLFNYMKDDLGIKEFVQAFLGKHHKMFNKAVDLPKAIDMIKERINAMMSKKVTFGTSPKQQAEPPNINPDAWVQSRNSSATKRLTVDVPEVLHRRIKLSCAMRGTRMVEELNDLLEQHYPEQEYMTM